MLTAELLSDTFGLPLVLERRDGRFFFARRWIPVLFRPFCSLFHNVDVVEQRTERGLVSRRSRNGCPGPSAPSRPPGKRVDGGAAAGAVSSVQRSCGPALHRAGPAGRLVRALMHTSNVSSASPRPRTGLGQVAVEPHGDLTGGDPSPPMSSRRRPG